MRGNMESVGSWPALLLTISLCVSLSGALAPSQSVKSTEAVSRREPRAAALTDTVVPSAYRIHISPDYAENLTDTTTFTGRVHIDLAIGKATRNVLLHAGNGMKVNKATIEGSDGKLIALDCSKAEDIVTCNRKSNLPIGKYTLDIEFTGEFQADFNGFYKSTYKKSDGETGVLFTTQFQAPDARKAFPCFDEPNWKATFLLTIDVPPNYSALSNTPIADLQEGSTSTTITFHETVKMSTYLVAFIVYEIASYSYVESNFTSDISIKTWARKNAIDNGLAEYSNEVTPKILLELENYTRIPYLRDNMTKIDQAAIPHFSAGAMENWGLVTYRETRLFFDDTRDTEVTRKSVAAIIAHELVHQWFGNLVTTKWWDTTWLNEGFARYMQYLILSRVYPEWRMMEQLLVDQQMSVFLLDAVDTAKHLSHDVTTPQEINGQFGTITYSKGASFLRMISNAIGEENFQDALEEYLRSNEYGSVTPHNLYENLEKKTPEDRRPLDGLEAALETWTQQPGFPVVKIQRDYEGYINISQERFFSDGPKQSSVEIYHIPITWSTKENDTANFLWLTKQSAVVSDPLEIENWLLIRAKGYYRVRYDEGVLMTLMWTMVRGNRASIAPEDRAQLVDDAFALAAAGYLPFREARYVMRCLSGETDVLPWAAATRGLDRLDSFLGTIDFHGIFYRYVRNATLSIYETLGGFSHNGSSIELIHRPTVLRWACRAGHKDCVQNAVSLLRDHQEKGEKLDPNLKSVIACYGIMNGNDTMWRHLWNSYNSSADETERAAALAALGCSKDKETLTTFLKGMCEEAGEIKASEVTGAFSAALSHAVGIDITVDFVLEQLSQFMDSLPESIITSILRNVASHISSEAHYKELEVWLERQFQKGALPGALVDELAASMKKNVAWVTKYSDEAFDALEYATPGEEYIPPSSTPEPSHAPYTTLKVQVLIGALSFLILTH